MGPFLLCKNNQTSADYFLDNMLKEIIIGFSDY